MTIAIASVTGNAFLQEKMEIHKRVFGRSVGGSQSRVEVAQEVLKGRTVLLIEDSWLIAQGYKSLLEMAGMEVIGPAASVGDAEELLNSDVKPDFALVDINLEGGGDSYGLIDGMVLRGIPVVIISGIDVEASVATKVDCVLPKPIGGSTLMATLRRVGAARNLSRPA